MDKRITVWSNGRVWMATFHGDQEMISAFGTDTIPTPWMASADGLKVAENVAARNPGHAVTLREAS